MLLVGEGKERRDSGTVGSGTEETRPRPRELGCLRRQLSPGEAVCPPGLWICFIIHGRVISLGRDWPGLVPPGVVCVKLPRLWEVATPTPQTLTLPLCLSHPGAPRGLLEKGRLLGHGWPCKPCLTDPQIVRTPPPDATPDQPLLLSLFRAFPVTHLQQEGR